MTNMVGAGKKDPLPEMGNDPLAESSGRHEGGESPQWAFGLKRLYDQVVDEPIPDSFMDLLSKLDDAGK